MKFASIVPIQYDPVKFSDFHLILAHEILVDPIKRAYYEDAARRGHRIILDNGVIELGASVKLANLMEAWDHFPEACLVVPDSIRNFTKTIEAAEDFAEFIDDVDLDESFTLMVVPQGSSIKQWIECLREQLDLFAGRTNIVVGIGRYAEDAFDGGRQTVYDAAQSVWNGDYHLLGIQHSITEVYWARSNANIWGVDSSLPARAALVGLPSDSVENLRELPDVTEFTSGILPQVQTEMARCNALLQGMS
jgi:hypothetical protein